MSRADAEYSRAFYDWEWRGRGWYLWPEPVELEPPFKVPRWPSSRCVDDGRKSSAGSRFLQRVSSFISPPQRELPEVEEAGSSESMRQRACANELTFLRVGLPHKSAAKAEEFERILHVLSYCEQHISFELVGKEEGVFTQFAGNTTDIASLQERLSAVFTDATFAAASDALNPLWLDTEGFRVAVEYGLAREFLFLLRRPNHDPYLEFITALSKCASGEAAVLQILFQPVREAWGYTLLQAFSVLGSILVAKFQQAAMARERLPENDRPDFIIAVDEFQNFVTPSVAEMLTGTRKYRVGLVLAHQDFGKIKSTFEVENAVKSIPSIRVAFRIGAMEAKQVESTFSHFDSTDFQNTPDYHAICRIERNDFDFNLRILPPEHPSPEEAAANSTRARCASNSKFASKRTDFVESTVGSSEATHGAEADAKTDRGTSRPTEQEAPSKSEAASNHAPRHEWIKDQIVRRAASLSYVAQREVKVLGERRIDLVLRRGRLTIACEVAEGNHVSYELENIQKCLDAKFERIAVVSLSQEHLDSIKTQAQQLVIPVEWPCVTFYVFNQFFNQLKLWADADDLHPAFEVVRDARDLHRVPDDFFTDLIQNLLNLSRRQVAGFVDQVRKYELRYGSFKVTNAFMEGLNSVFSATKRRARGYRSSAYLITVLYLVAAKLKIPFH